MLSDRIEGKWIDLFAEVFVLCTVERDELSIDEKVVVRDGMLVE